MIIAATSLRSATTTIRTKVTRSSVVHITRQSQLDFWPHIRRLSDKSFRHLTKQIAANDSLPQIRLRYYTKIRRRVYHVELNVDISEVRGLVTSCCNCFAVSSRLDGP